MKKVAFFLLAVSSYVSPCLATDHTDNDLLSMISLTPSTATRGSVTSILGKPLKVEENKKRTLWYYNHDNTDVVLSWSNKTASLLRVSFKNNPDKKGIFDNSIPSKLQSGKTDLAQALKILGIPHDVTIKEKTQEMHYNYQEKVLRLFFRDKVLVDYCLY